MTDLALVSECVCVTRLANIAIAVTGLVCLAALGISVYPGALQTLFFFSFFIGLMISPVIALIVLVIAIMYWRRGKLTREYLANLRVPRTHIIAMVAMLFVTYGLLKFYVPRRVAFEYSRSAFDALVTRAPAPDGSVKLDAWAGIYRVDEAAADSRGGVYYRVHSGGDGIGPDITSYGFVYRPNREGTPFGSAYYRLGRLGGGWHWFRASDDW